MGRGADFQTRPFCLKRVHLRNYITFPLLPLAPAPPLPLPQRRHTFVLPPRVNSSAVSPAMPEEGGEKNPTPLQICVWLLCPERVKACRSQGCICFHTYNESKDSRRARGSQFSLKGKTDPHGYRLFVDKQRLKSGSVFQGLEGREKISPLLPSPHPTPFQ